MKRRPHPPPDSVPPDFGADGPASIARPSTVRPVEAEAGHGTVNVRECRDVLAIDRLLGNGQITPDQHAAGLALNRAFRNAGFHRRTVSRYDSIGGGEAEALGLREWHALIDRVPQQCRHIVVSVCCADGDGQMPTSDRALRTLRMGLDAFKSAPRKAPDAMIRAAWSGPPETR